MSPGRPTDSCGVTLALALAFAMATAGCSKGVEPLPPPTSASLAQPAASAKLPPLAVADLGGRLSTTDSLRGRILVLNVWATWCAPCRREMPSLDKLHRELDPSRYLVAGVSVDDDPVLVREYLAQQRLGFANFVAVRRSDVLDALALRGIPATLVVAADGTVLHRITGPRDWNSAEVREMLEAAYDARARRNAQALQSPQRGRDDRS